MVAKVASVTRGSTTKSIQPTVTMMSSQLDEAIQIGRPRTRRVYAEVVLEADRKIGY